ncbi:hypothetical protein [Altererythrobacter sp. MF3-039]|uniref:hypothetical protein n=1 Tax=Altererythrobacter sp. MF3-039 TaxID=3252901 RepID=UPI00390C8B16
MSTVVMPLSVLIPFALMLVVTLAIFGMVRLKEGYRAPDSVQDSLKHILSSVGVPFVFLMVVYLVLDGFEVSERVSTTAIGTAGAVVVLVVVDLVAICLKQRRTRALDQND